VRCAQAGEKWRIPTPPVYIKRNWKTIIPPESNKKAAARQKRPLNGVSAPAAALQVAPSLPAHPAAAPMSSAAAASALPAGQLASDRAGDASCAHRPKQKREGGAAVNGAAADKASVKQELLTLNKVGASLPHVDMMLPPPQVLHSPHPHQSLVPSPCITATRACFGYCGFGRASDIVASLVQATISGSGRSQQARSCRNVGDPSRN
jgi:hypothetical protein